MHKRNWPLIGCILALVSACNALPVTPNVIYVTATPVPVALLPTATLEETPLFGPTDAETPVTFVPLPTNTLPPPTRRQPSETPSFTPEFTDTAVPPRPTVDVKKCTVGMQPNGFTSLYQSNKTLQSSLGCPQSGAVSISSATITFDNGMMLWASSFADQPRKAIYVLFNSGAYLRFDDSWTEGVDPVDTGESAPAGKKAPIRGFGKIWKQNAAVKTGLGWALTDEAGTGGQLQRFERGEMFFVASTGQTFIFADGKWRADGTKF